MPETLAVFSHPNHELAIFGVLQRWQPALLYLTDGGGPHRVAQTEAGLRSIGLLDRATFLNHSEQSFYDALLDGDVEFLAGVAARVADVIGSVGAGQVLCDAVEYYNPVHDLSLPLVKRAVSMSQARDGGTTILEVPLIRQVQSASNEVYAVQRPLPGGGPALEFHLDGAELASKMMARDHIYTLLRDQLGPVLAALPDEHLATETLLPARPLNGPAAGDCLRYERRAELLLGQGAIERPITYAGHFLPVARSLARQGPSRDAVHPV